MYASYVNLKMHGSSSFIHIALHNLSKYNFYQTLCSVEKTLIVFDIKVYKKFNVKKNANLQFFKRNN